MADLFNRDFAVNVGGLRIESRTQEGQTRPTLRVTFRIELSVQKTANTAELSIYNLNKDRRSFLADAATLATSIEAGYIENRSRIFLGDLDYGNSSRTGNDWVTTIQSRDGGNAWQNRIAESFKNIKLGELLERLVKASGLELGNAARAALAGPQRGDAAEFIKGIVVNGLAVTEIDKAARQLGLRFSVQGGKAQFLTPTETLSGKAIILSEGTGLVGSPEPGDKGSVTAKALLQPDLLPGQAVRFDTAEIQGFYRVDRSIFTGDTWGGDWYTEIEAKQLT